MHNAKYHFLFLKLFRVTNEYKGKVLKATIINFTDNKKSHHNDHDYYLSNSQVPHFHTNCAR